MQTEHVSTHLVFIRHCSPISRCTGSAECMSGWADFPLGDEGRAQAALLARRLQADGNVFAGLYSSPLRRAADTARAMFAHSSISIQFLTSLREIGCGIVDGLPIARVKALYPASWEENLSQQNEHFRWPGGESYLELRRRCVEAVELIARLHADQRVAIVTHSGVISQIVGSIHGLSPAQWQPFRPGCASFTEVAWQRGSGHLITFDDRAHLEGSMVAELLSD